MSIYKIRPIYIRDSLGHFSAKAKKKKKLHGGVPCTYFIRSDDQHSS